MDYTGRMRNRRTSGRRHIGNPPADRERPADKERPVGRESPADKARRRRTSGTFDRRTTPSTGAGPFAAGCLAGVLCAACGAGGPEPDPDPGPRPDFQPTATVEELMRSVIDPAADGLWDAVVITSTLDGIERRVPDSDEDWLALEHHAVRLLEAGNLLQIEGRPIAAADSVSELPGIDLEPADIAVRVAAQYDVWLRTARELHAAGVTALDAVRARNIDALLASGDRLDAACESCHSRFWYPPAAAEGESEP